MNTNNFSLRHIGPNAQDQKDMLDTLGVASLDQLINETIPDGIRLNKSLDLALLLVKPLKVHFIGFICCFIDFFYICFASFKITQ